MITLNDVKTGLGINNTSKDETISLFIPLIYEQLENYVGWNDLTVLKMIEYNLNNKSGIASEGISRHSLSFVNEYPSSIMRGIRRKL